MTAPPESTRSTVPTPAESPQPTTTAKAGGNGDVTSGDRSKLTAAKNGLKAKVASGKASDKEAAMLRALCRQLGDMSCAN